MPSLLKEWFDVVLEHGWAYGAGGTALHGKGFWSVLTTGSGSDAYQETGEHKHPFAAFLPPFLQTARLCGMRWITPYILHGAHQVDEAVISAHIAEFQKRLSTYPDWTALTDQSTQQITKGEQHGS